MIVEAVVCPGAPLFVPRLSTRLAASVPELEAACRTVVTCLAGTARVLVVSTGRRGAGTVVRGPGSPISAGSLARSDLPVAPDALLPAGPGSAAAQHGITGGGPSGKSGAAAVGTIVAAHLLAAAGISVPTTAVEIDPTVDLAGTDPTGMDAIGTDLSGSDPCGAGPAGQVRTVAPDLDGPTRTGLLVIADGAASHGPSAPGAEDPASVEFDEELRACLAAGDPAALAGFCQARHDQAAVLRCETLTAFAALAGLTIDRPPTRARIEHYGAPFGVGYLVARWQWPSTG